MGMLNSKYYLNYNKRIAAQGAVYCRITQSVIYEYTVVVIVVGYLESVIDG